MEHQVLNYFEKLLERVDKTEKILVNELPQTQTGLLFNILENQEAIMGFLITLKVNPDSVLKNLNFKNKNNED